MQWYFIIVTRLGYFNMNSADQAVACLKIFWTILHVSTAQIWTILCRSLDYVMLDWYKFVQHSHENFRSCSGLIPPSTEEYRILRLLIHSRIKEFHVELELLPLLLWRLLLLGMLLSSSSHSMEDSYNRVLIARHTIPEKFYDYFMDFLAKTVSCYLQKLYTK